MPTSTVEKLARNGITVVTQPGFLCYSGERCLAAGSGAPVIPMNPLMGIYAAATRRAESGGALLPGEAVGVEDALRMYTLGSAYASFEEEVTGSIEEGKRADLVLLDRDPTAVDPDEVKDIRVVMTVGRDEVVWEV